MFTAWSGSHKWTVTLVALLLTCLAAPVRGDEARFLPDGEHLLLSFKVPAFLQSRTFAEVKKRSPEAARKITMGFEENLGVAGDNIERIVIGMGFPRTGNGTGRSLNVVITKKPVTFHQIKASLGAGASDYAWKERKVAMFTIHTPGDNPPPEQSWQPFCVAEDRIVLNGTLAAITAILKRNKAPNLAAGMRSGLELAGSDNALSLVADFQRLRAERDEDKLPGVFDGMPLELEALKGVDVLAIKLNEADQFTASATFLCKDAAATAAVVKMIDSLRDTIKIMTGNPGQVPQLQQQRMKAIGTLAEAVTVSRTGNRVTATMAVEPAVVGALLHSLFAPPANQAPAADPRQK